MSASSVVSKTFQISSISEKGKVECSENLVFKDVQMYVQNPNKTFSLRCNDNGNKYMSIGHNLKYNKDLNNAVSILEHIDFKQSLCNYDSKFNDYTLRNVFNISKMGDKYLNFYVNFIKRFENDTKYDNLQVFVKDEEIFHESLDDFMKLIDNKYLNYKMTMYINIFVNHQTKKITVKPCLFSLNFNLEPKINNTLINFINLSKEEQNKMLDPYINESLDNRDFSRMKNPCFIFKGLKFRFPMIDMCDYKDYMLPKKFSPSSWIGKQEKLEKDAPGKESFKIVCDENIKKFMDILENYFKDNFEKFQDVFLNEMRKSKKNPNGFNIKLTKKDNIEFLMPVSYHEEINEIKDEDGIIVDEEIVENGLTMHLLKMMQPTLDEDKENDWEKIPKNLNYKLSNPTIFVNKLFYYEKDKTFRLQLSFSKYIDIKTSEISSNQDSTYKSLLNDNETKKEVLVEKEEDTTDDTQSENDYEEVSEEEEN